jgi:primary-amine oxidase
MVRFLGLFEMDTGFPIRRHSTVDGGVSITKNIAFVLRTVSTIANYDYMTSYEFYMDGSIQVSIRASGYIESSYWAHNSDYGFKIHDNLSGSMHDHVITFKADFDILGQKNTIQRIDVIPTTET